MNPQLLILFFLVLLSSRFSLLLAALPEPHPVPVQPLTSPTSTIPAFPEQSDLSSTSSSCPLSLPVDLSPLPSSCSPASPPARCCPSLAAFLYSAFAPTALSLPAAALAFGLPDLPDLPDDSESCAGQVEKALKARGVQLPRVNDTCDVAYCYCGVRLRRLTCAGSGFEADEKEGRWVATEENGRRLERECSIPGIAGCSRCLRALDQLNTNMTGSDTNEQTNQLHDNERECQLMGLTWLLSKNRTLYLPTATSVLHAYMAVPDTGEAGPTSCLLPRDEMPFAVGSAELDGDDESLASVGPLSKLSFALPLMVLLILSSSIP